MGSIAIDDDTLPHETLTQIRTGRVKPVFNKPGVTSGIYKTPRTDRVPCTLTGLQSDESAYHLHGGPENALLQYCPSHYAAWIKELPESAQFFRPGAFGENLIGDCGAMSEENVCIGDVVQIGDGEEGVLAQVSHPRQPCFKLNLRFEVKNMAQMAQEKSRTGWYYRILKEGSIQTGGCIKVVERKHPKWTVANVQRYLHREVGNESAMRELVELEELAEEAKDIFRQRLRRKMEKESEDDRLIGGMEDRLDAWADFRVVEKRRETKRIASFVFEALDAPAGEPVVIGPGSHVRVKLGGNKLVRAYSVVSGTTARFELGVALADDGGRGGSVYLHQNVQKGDVLSLSKISTSFPLSPQAKHHIFVAGGIGITAFIATLRHLDATASENGSTYELHLAVRSTEEIPFERYIQQIRHISIYDGSKGQRINLNHLLQHPTPATHIYCCGPERLMSAVSVAAKAHKWPENNVHFETFTIATSGDPFTAELAHSKRSIDVAGKQTLLDALREAGMDLPSSCEAGNCGTCRVGVLKGKIEHRGTGLMQQEKEDGSAMLSCVSRGIGAVVLDL